MANEHQVQVQEKREVEKKQEGTVPGRVFLAVADIFETDQALTVILEMPGVNKDSVDIRVPMGSEPLGRQGGKIYRVCICAE
jgi:HSP20 family molecular chaperone IbpA